MFPAQKRPGTLTQTRPRLKKSNGFQRKRCARLRTQRFQQVFNRARHRVDGGWHGVDCVFNVGLHSLLIFSRARRNDGRGIISRRNIVKFNMYSAANATPQPAKKPARKRIIVLSKPARTTTPAAVQKLRQVPTVKLPYGGFLAVAN